MAMGITMRENNDLIGRTKKNNFAARVARNQLHFSDVVCKTAT